MSKNRGSAAVIAMAALFIFSGCSAGDDAAATLGPTSTAAEDSTTTEVAAPSILDSITAAGGSCEAPEARSEQVCIVNGVEFQLAVDGWTRQAADRERACAEGYVDTNYQVLSDGTWVLSTDYNDDLEMIQTTLAADGVNGTIRPYCE